MKVIGSNGDVNEVSNKRKPRGAELHGGKLMQEDLAQNERNKQKIIDRMERYAGK